MATLLVVALGYLAAYKYVEPKFVAGNGVWFNTASVGHPYTFGNFIWQESGRARVRIERLAPVELPEHLQVLRLVAVREDSDVASTGAAREDVLAGRPSAVKPLEDIHLVPGEGGRNFQPILVVLEADALGQYYTPGLRVHWSVGPIRGSAITGRSMELNVDTVGGDRLASQVPPTRGPHGAGLTH